MSEFDLDIPSNATAQNGAAGEELRQKLSDQWWRLNNLYHITNRQGVDVLFRPNWAQRILYRNMHYRNLVLKARKLGVTTWWQIFCLDECLFNSGTQAGVIAHTIPDAEEIFRTKIKYPYEHLPEYILKQREARKSDGGHLVLNNDSSIRVATSMRSGNINILHVSEFGPISVKNPDKAEEIISGANEAVPQGGIIALESTAKGRAGKFYDYCTRAMAQAAENLPYGPFDWKLHFFPWWQEPGNTLEAPYPIETNLREYFRRLKADHGIRLTLPQKRWYCAKIRDLGDLMFSEHPSYPEEAFYASMEGAYFRKELTTAREQGRIGRVPVDPGALVDTWWDLGMNDQNVIWFTQDVAREIHVVDFYQNSNEGLGHYRDILEEKGYRYGRHVAPHDIRVRELSSGATRLQHALELGIRFDMAPRLRKEDQIQAARRIFALCWFDKERCAEGIRYLEEYKKDWDDSRGTWRDKPVKDNAAHVADAFEVFAVAHDFGGAHGGHRGPVEVQPANMQGWV